MWVLCGHASQLDIFEFWVAYGKACSPVDKNGHQKVMFYDERKLCVQNIDNFLDSTVKIVESA